MNKVTLEEKIEIFKRFRETGMELNGKTTFENYPVGQWAIQIRNQLNKGRKLSKEDFEKLESLGILERNIESTIDEKISALIEWNEKYPRIMVMGDRKPPIELIQEYSNSEEETTRLVEAYEKMQKYYGYVIERMNRNKLEKEQIIDCKEGNLRGVFGYPTRTEELAKEYRIDESKVDYIIGRHGSMESFVSKYKNGELDELDKSILLNNLKVGFDLDLGEQPGYERLVLGSHNLDMMSDKFTIYSSKEVNERLGALQPRDKQVLEQRFGLIDGNPKTFTEIGESFNISFERVRQIQEKALKAVKRDEHGTLSKHYYPEEQEEESLIAQEIKNVIFDSNFIFYPDEKYSNEPINIDVEKFQHYSKLLNGIRESKINEIKDQNVDNRQKLSDLIKASREKGIELDKARSLEREYEKQQDKTNDKREVGEYNIGE